MKEYIIVGDNNFWYSFFQAKTKAQIKAEIKEVKKLLKNKQYDDNNCCQLYVYEAKEIERIEVR